MHQPHFDMSELFISLNEAVYFTQLLLHLNNNMCSAIGFIQGRT